MNRKIYRCPAGGEKILKLFTPDHECESFIGDVEEYYNTLLHDRGKIFANIWFWFQILRSVVNSIKISIFWSFIMFGNYLKTTLRNLVRFKGYALINILGLAAGLSCCILILLFIRDEISYDKFHENADRIVRIVTSTNRDGTPSNANGIWATGPALKEDYAAVVDYVRLRKVGYNSKIFVGYENKKFYEEKFFFADPGIFSVFSFKLKSGTSETALDEPNTIVLTENIAFKYFGDVDPIGKSIIADPYNSGDLMEFTVTGIAENVPWNSHFHFDFLASYISQKERTRFGNFSGMSQHWTYLLLEEGASYRELNATLLDFLKRRWRENPWYTNSLQPLLDIRLKSHLKSEIEPNGNITYVYAFAVIALFVLVIACINFMNLTTAQAAARTKEVGMRKVAGAFRGQLVSQFLGESLTLTAISAFVSIIMLYFLMPLFNMLADKNFSIGMIADPLIIVSVTGLVAIVGFISGSYPALMLSSFKPANILKGNLTSGLRFASLRKTLVVFQFAVSIAMIIATGIALQQLNFIKNENTGYAKDQIVILPLNNEIRESYESLRNQLVSYAGISNVTTSMLVPTRGSSHNTFRFEGFDEDYSIARYPISKEFVDTYGMEIIAGEDISKKALNQDVIEILVSERVLEEVGIESPEAAIGMRAYQGKQPARIAGVVNDMNLYSFRRDIYSILYFISPIRMHNFMSIRLDSGSPAETIRFVEDNWNRFSPTFPFDYFFLDTSFAEMHRAERKLSEVFIWFTLLAIFISCLGLAGLAAFTSERRRKEIGIRKVLGSSVSKIVLLMSRDIVILVCIANIIAWPVTYFFMNRWLQGFAYRTEISPALFFGAALAELLIAMVTVSYQTLKAANTNPVNSLRYE